MNRLLYDLYSELRCSLGVRRSSLVIAPVYHTASPEFEFDFGTLGVPLLSKHYEEKLSGN